ncbi:ATPase family protein associated with various cellular activities (AAA) [Kribbella sp. VKM Ac-2527]|uniref:ATPase family protein associated with various cellular activities (AAA) n=1 Tax=Kribbella caucasensis TaxID=2512215 RepID=A0A4R6K916_9ACTN|nr:AAA family ATPase [Kribbella sp. VKM Ac-2527]TDO45329.1 ATPase family protein associated with various cellular activities (AAA) [Kribbella sp. VKM Ac-2527]
MADDTRRPRVLDVLAADQPWEVPDDWLAGIRGQLRTWADDPSALRPDALPEFVRGTPAAVWFTHQVAPLLTGWIPVLHGECADIAAVLTRDFYRPSVRFGGAGHVVRVAAGDWPLQVVSGARGFPEEGRRQALLMSRDVVSLFVDAPPMAARARALTTAFDRVLADREVTRMHMAADYETIAQFWATAVLSDDERAVLPELAGPASALQYSLSTLRDAHAKLSTAIPDDEAGDFAQLLARLILATGLSGQPPAVGQILGVAGWDVENALADLRNGFDPHTWLAGNTEWLARAVRQEQEVLARSWAAAATRVSVHLAGVLADAPWPEPQVPDLGAFFRLLDRERWAVADTPGASGTANQPATTAALLGVWGSVQVDGPADQQPAGAVAAEGAPEPVAGAEPAVEGAPEPVAGAQPAVESIPEPPVEVEPTAEGVPQQVVEAEPAAEAVPEPAVDVPAVAATEVPPMPADAAVPDPDMLAVPKPVDHGVDALAELDSLIGLESVKDAVHRMVAEIKTNLRRKDLGLPTHERARHMVFVGKPGTAKTTIARLLARIYKQLGVLESGHVVEVDRSDLVGSGVGTTAPMTAGKFREALGGVLFIDEAYTLVPEHSPGDYGLEAVATILKMMEDYRDECVVIVAGYHREMQRFMDSNTGLASRFPKLLSFSEYDTDQLVAIFELQARQKGMIYTDAVMDVVRKVIPPAPRGHSFGNGRFIRNILEEAISNQATRLSERDPDGLTERELRELLPEDVKPAASMRAEDYLLQKPGT